MKPSPALPPARSPDPRAGPWGCGSCRSTAQTGRGFPDGTLQAVLPALPPLPRSVHTPQVRGLPETFQLTLATASTSSRPRRAVNVVSRPLPPFPGCLQSPLPLPALWPTVRHPSRLESLLSPLRQDGPSCWASPCLERTPFAGLGPTARLTLLRCQLRAPRFRGGVPCSPP